MAPSLRTRLGFLQLKPLDSRSHQDKVGLATHQRMTWARCCHSASEVPSFRACRSRREGDLVWTDGHRLQTDPPPRGTEWVAMALAMEKESELQTSNGNGDYY